MTKFKKKQLNTVPDDFMYFYTPILNVKKTLQDSKITELKPNEILHGLSMIHYASFFMSEIYRQKNKDVLKILTTRSLIEDILEVDSYNLENKHISMLISFVDQVAKELNINIKPYIYIALYQANETAEIYRNIHNNLGIYDFISSADFLGDSVYNSLKSYHDISIELLIEQGFLANKQTKLFKKDS